MAKPDTGGPDSESGLPLLRIRGLGVSFGPVDAISPLDLDVHDGEFLTILGPSGSGKTTLLRAIAGFQPPSAGRIEFDGRDIADLPINRRPFNTVFQDYALFPHMTVRENVGFGLRVRGTARRQMTERVDIALGIVGLEELDSRYPAQLSGGQQQRTALARAMICEPRLILLDEPLAALDATLRRQMQNFLKSVQRQSGITFLFVTHDQSEAITMSDRICVMRTGNIEQIGTPRELYYRPKSRFVAAFFGASNIVEPCRIEESRDDMTVVSTPVGTFSVKGPPPENTSGLALAIRPEAFGSDAETRMNSLEFEVAAVSFVGSETITELRHRNTSLMFTMKSRSDPAARPPETGSFLRVGFDPAECALVTGAES
ncbi:MAG: ABC transporter ATP-binding protein [Paracoccaceae bacterium]|nr:ABC transporter ATP-binding protein [Paracoccaceae bacterium]